MCDYDSQSPEEVMQRQFEGLSLSYKQDCFSKMC